MNGVGLSLSFVLDFARGLDVKSIVFIPLSSLIKYSFVWSFVLSLSSRFTVFNVAQI